MRELDEQERAIAKALIKDPRISDNRLGEEYGIPVRTVSRKRARLESEGLLRYFAELDMSERGTGRFRCRHLYTIKFGVGVTLRDLKRRVLNEPNVMTAFTRSVYTSHIAEIDGRVALVLIVDGESDADIVERVQEEIIPALKAKHGDNAVEEVETVRLLQPIRMLRNYLPGLNMEAGKMRADWSVDAIFVE
jgi:DNA-binding Lrp family transcriptional regulator